MVAGRVAQCIELYYIRVRIPETGEDISDLDITMVSAGQALGRNMTCHNAYNGKANKNWEFFYALDQFFPYLQFPLIGAGPNPLK